MSQTLTSALGKVAAVLLLIAAVALAYLVVAQPLLARIAELEERLLSERMLLGRLGKAVATAKKEQLAAADFKSEKSEVENGDNLFLSGESAGVMAAQVQDVLQKMARSNAMNLASMRTVGVRQHDNLSLIGIDARLEGGLENLQNMLLAIEASRPVLIVDALQLAPTSLTVRDNGGADVDAPLSVRLLVLGASRERLGDN